MKASFSLLHDLRVAHQLVKPGFARARGTIAPTSRVFCPLLASVPVMSATMALPPAVSSGCDLLGQVRLGSGVKPSCCRQRLTLASKPPPSPADMLTLTAACALSAPVSANFATRNGPPGDFLPAGRHFPLRFGWPAEAAAAGTAPSCCRHQSADATAAVAPAPAPPGSSRDLRNSMKAGFCSRHQFVIPGHLEKPRHAVAAREWPPGCGSSLPSRDSDRLARKAGRLGPRSPPAAPACASSSSDTGPSPTWPRQRFTLSRSLPARPGNGTTLTSACLPSLPATRKEATRICPEEPPAIRRAASTEAWADHPKCPGGSGAYQRLKCRGDPAAFLH